MDDGNSYYTCECIYFSRGFLVCSICYNIMIDKQPRVVCRRWSKNKKIFLNDSIYSNLITPSEKLKASNHDE